MSNYLIIILDLDNTIIGNCCYQADLYNLQKIQKKYKMKIINNINVSYNKKCNLLRPHFKYFYENIKKIYENVYIYIYTASEKNWANIEVKMIEKNLDIEFDKPIFTRDDCIIDSKKEYKKVINKIIPKIKRNIKDDIEDIKNNLLIIDNNDTFIDYKTNFLLCKSYDFIHYIDIWKNINNDYHKNSELTNYIIRLINNNKIHKYVNINDKNLENIYKWKYKKYKKINKTNKKFIKDTFWKDLTDIIIDNKFKKFNKDTIYYLQKKLNN